MAEEKTKELLELQVPTTQKSLVEALVFAAKEPLTISQIRAIYQGEGPQAFLHNLDGDEIIESIEELNAEYDKTEKPYRIVQIAGGYQFSTLPIYAEWLGRLYKEQSRRKLSQSGIETLAIVSYKQPITKADIETIRGVNCDYVLKTLLEKELVTVVGRAHAPGRPLLYGTTREFLKHFGLNEITDLPRPREIEEILGESQFETERRMLEAQAGAEKMKEEEPDFKSRLPHIPKKKPELDGSVEIVPKKSQREIRTVRTEKSLEQGQEAIDFTKTWPAEPTKGPASETVDSGRLEMPADASSIEGIGNIGIPPGMATPLIDDLSSPPLYQSQPQSDASQDTEIDQATLQSRNTDELQGLEPRLRTAPDASVDEGEQYSEGNRVANSSSILPSSEKKTKWQSWKEKVQGFIRKIFG
jgi:segregation and condensation protein B